MGRAMPFLEDQSFEEKFKCLADEELLEIWVESQQIEHMLNANIPTGYAMPPDLERAIINELSARMGKRLASSAHSGA